jgi:hypothetical protein
MTRRPKQVRDSRKPEYPSLAEHRQSRRQFLAVGGLAAGAGVLASACGRMFPWLDDDDTVTLGGVPEEPTYRRIRLPAEPGERGTYLIDSGYASFWAVALTYDLDCGLFAVDHVDALADALVPVISGCTYEQLLDPNVVANLQPALLEALDAVYHEDTGDVGQWFTAVELTLTRLDAPQELGGVAPEPSYP